MNTVNDDQNYQGIHRIYGLPIPYDSSEATNKYYVDRQIEEASGGSGSGGGISDALMLMGG